MEIKTAREICEEEVKYCDAENIEFSGSEEDYDKEYVAVEELLDYIENSRSPDGDYPDADCIAEKLKSLSQSGKKVD